MFPALRLHHGIAGKKSTTKKVPVFRGADHFQLDPDIAPGRVALPSLEFPDEITGARRLEDAVALCGWYLASTTEDADEREKAQNVGSTVNIPLGHFIRTIAHIGHAFYMGIARNPVREESFLLPIAQGDLRCSSRVIGGWNPDVINLPDAGLEDGIHQIVPTFAKVGDETYLMALIRLFTHLRPMPPVYSCLVASRPIPEGKQYLSFTRKQGLEGVHIEPLTMGE